MTVILNCLVFLHPVEPGDLMSSLPLSAGFVLTHELITIQMSQIVSYWNTITILAVSVDSVFLVVG